MACWEINNFVNRLSREEKPNAGAHLLPEAGAQRTLEAVGCRRLILIEAPSSTDPRGRLVLGKT
jgi:hypothetical protein